MRKFLYLLILLLTVLIQITWAPFLNWRGYPLPLVLLILLVGTLFWQMTEVLTFAFVTGIFFSLLSGGIVGLESLSLILALTVAYIARNLFLTQKWLGFFLGCMVAVIIYEIWFFFF